MLLYFFLNVNLIIKLLKIKIKRGGTLYFKLSSFLENKQINFAVFKMSNDFDLSTLEQVRCIYSGTDYSLDPQTECHVSTGLTPSEIDEFEAEGCEGNGYGAAVNTEDGDEYLLIGRLGGIIINYSKDQKSCLTRTYDYLQQTCF